MTSIFTNQVPASWVTDAAAYALGLRFNSSAGGNVTGGRFYLGGREMDGKTITIALYQVSGTVLKASKTKVISAGDPVGWVNVTFDTPVAITSGTDYMIVYHHATSAMYYPFTSGFFGSPLTNSPLTAVAANCYFDVSASLVMPFTLSGTNNAYFVDVLFSLPAAGGYVPTKNDTIMAALVAAGYTTGTIDDRERKRLLTLLALTEPQNKSLQDLYKLAGEKPRLP